MTEQLGAKAPSGSGVGGMLAVFTSVPQFIDDEYNDWYNTDHVPERMAVPGFLSARRYEAVDADIRYLCAYEVESPEVLGTAAYLRCFADPSPSQWTPRLAAFFVAPGMRHILRTSTLANPEPLPGGLARGCWVAGATLTKGGSDPIADWVASGLVESLQNVAGVLRVSAYIASDGVPSHLLFVDAITASVFAQPDFVKAAASFGDYCLSHDVKEVLSGSYRLIFSGPDQYLPGERSVDWDATPPDAGPPS